MNKLVALLLLMLPLTGWTQFTDSNLPIVKINTNSQTIVDNSKIFCDMGIIYNGIGNRNFVTDTFTDYNGYINIEIRGSTSQQYPKKSYGFETQNADSTNNNVSLLGMPIENDWILYAPYPDKTMIRNVLAYYLFGRMKHYSTRTRYCELVINGQYRGVYVLLERIKRDKNRVDIAKLDNDDLAGDSLTGGYIVKIDKTTGQGNDSWTSPYSNKVWFQFHYPKDDSMAPVQKSYIESVVTGFETALWGVNFDHPTLGYRPYVNVFSFIDFMIMQELGRTVDGYRSSAFLHKNRDGKDPKLHMGPMWDFNLSYGNADYCDAYEIVGWQYEFNNICWWFDPEVPFWWEKLVQDTMYTNQLRCQWDTLRQGPFHTDSLHAFVDSVALWLDESQQRNFVKWPILGQYVNWNYFVGQTYQEEIDYLKTWLQDRTAWMDQNIPGTCWPNTLTLIKENDNPQALISVFPNPFNNQLTIELDLSESGELQLELLEITGKSVLQLGKGAVFSGSLSRVVMIPADIAAGLYLLKVELNGQRIAQQRLMKQ